MNSPQPQKLASDPLRVLVYEEPAGWWNAVCLDRYMVGEGRSETVAIQALYRMIASEVVYRIEEDGLVDQPLDKLPKAPEDYWEMYNALKTPPTELDVPPILIAPRSALTPRAKPSRMRSRGTSAEAEVNVPLQVAVGA